MGRREDIRAGSGLAQALASNYNAQAQTRVQNAALLGQNLNNAFESMRIHRQDALKEAQQEKDNAYRDNAFNWQKEQAELAQKNRNEEFAYKQKMDAEQLGLAKSADKRSWLATRADIARTNAQTAQINQQYQTNQENINLWNRVRMLQQQPQSTNAQTAPLGFGQSSENVQQSTEAQAQPQSVQSLQPKEKSRPLVSVFNRAYIDKTSKQSETPNIAMIVNTKNAQQRAQEANQKLQQPQQPQQTQVSSAPYAAMNQAQNAQQQKQRNLTLEEKLAYGEPLSVAEQNYLAGRGVNLGSVNADVRLKQSSINQETTDLKTLNQIFAASEEVLKNIKEESGLRAGLNRKMDNWTDGLIDTDQETRNWTSAAIDFEKNVNKLIYGNQENKDKAKIGQQAFGMAYRMGDLGNNLGAIENGLNKAVQKFGDAIRVARIKGHDLNSKEESELFARYENAKHNLEYIKSLKKNDGKGFDKRKLALLKNRK
ncbi:hypothetical protein LS70_003940 [Helicobacter sp. MIT 11-5569]|uniref:hypothetical protein n=1 Tax=Helicobacter sp. MIT 11-5569 TaxID=1548151 RepID=UPI00051FD335|nr:hypothetical protein [Helicobacter sp. MIT 11-5569]TLD83967.1 hypothetical protein LS70_003940 [Helicobacter sp. MIT 11-5569]